MRGAVALGFVVLTSCGSEFSGSERTDVASDAGELADASSSGGRSAGGAGGASSSGGRGAGGASSSGGRSAGGASSSGGRSAGGASSGGSDAGVDPFNCTGNEECELVPGRPPNTKACCGDQSSPVGWHRCGYVAGLDCYGF